MLSLDAVISAILIAASVAFWRWWATRWAEPDELMKIVIGVMIAALAPLVLALASAVVAATGHPVSLIWAIAFHAVNDLGFANVLPHRPRPLHPRLAQGLHTGAMIGIFYLHLFFGNLLVGWLGGFLQKMPGVQFWLMHAGLMAASRRRAAAGEVYGGTHARTGIRGAEGGVRPLNRGRAAARSLRRIPAAPDGSAGGRRRY